MTDVAVPALDADEARAIVGRIRQCVSVALVEIKKAYAGRAWIALGYDSWADLCAAEFGEHIQLPRDERKAVTAELRAEGMSTRAIAAATGANHSTVVRDLAPTGGADAPPVPVVPVVALVTGVDGKTYPAVNRPPRVETPASLEFERERREREDVEMKAMARRQFNASVGNALFALSVLADVSEEITDFVVNYGTLGCPELGVDDLKQAARTLDQMINEWSAR